MQMRKLCIRCVSFSSTRLAREHEGPDNQRSPWSHQPSPSHGASKPACLCVWTTAGSDASSERVSLRPRRSGEAESLRTKLTDRDYQRKLLSRENASDTQSNRASLRIICAPE